ncbi:MAG TPA: GMC family oxidoreductase [Candidatus Hydrogenedentes bacterium]|nr:GMC family oxidoreductase [Candidatus Hydrogenedentota bacterium]HOV75836.1 GMC family oxidoreductase [Candidatus Hydrogenedentota bacterium]
MKTMTYYCKAAVIGTGAGGAVAGATLAEAGIDTILVEQGGVHDTAGHQGVLDGLTNMYADAAMTVALGRPFIPMPIGKAVGGSTIINSSTCFRPPRDRVAAWGGPSYEELEPFFSDIEESISVTTVDTEILGGNGRILKRGCDALGVELKPLRHNIRDCKGRGQCQYGCPEGAKQSMEKNFIPRALGAGARLLAGRRVDRLLMNDGKAVGVAGQGPEGRFEIRADVIVLAMGAFQTPAFLLRNDVANSSERVGRGLHVHPATRVLAEMDEIVDGFKGLPQGAYVDRWADRGIMLEGIFTPPGLMIAGAPGAGHALKNLAADYRRLSGFGVMVADTASGRVLRGRFGLPFIVLYQTSRRDAETMRFGIARLAEIFFAAGAKRVFTNFLPMMSLESPGDLKAFESAPVKPSYLEMMAFHPLGTCRMGSSPADSVVDFDLAAHDVPNLYIMDGSVVPGSLGVNPQITIMGLALRAARRLAARLRA